MRRAHQDNENWQPGSWHSFNTFCFVMVDEVKNDLRTDSRNGAGL